MMRAVWCVLALSACCEGLRTSPGPAAARVATRARPPPAQLPRVDGEGDGAGAGVDPLPSAASRRDLVAGLSASAIGALVVAPRGAAAGDGRPLAEASVGKSILRKASRKAFGGGVAGASAMVAQVLGFMWLRTVMNYQYTNGESGGTRGALEALWEEGGIRRLYRGVGWALVQSPASRFGDTAANAGVLALFELSKAADAQQLGGSPVAAAAIAAAATVPLWAQGFAGATVAALWRVAILPLDTFKTVAQVRGEEGKALLAEKLEARGIACLWDGAGAVWLATAVGHFPFFTVYNLLDASLPQASAADAAALAALLPLLRRAGIGFAASCVSDCTSNSLRVLKTVRQAGTEDESYVDIARGIVAQDGVQGLLGRGLRTRLLVNGLQGATFSVLWKYIEGLLAGSS